MNSDGIEARSTYEQKERIEKNREKVPKDVVDILKEKSSIAGVTDCADKQKFSSHIRKAYVDLQDAFNGRTKVIMEIVASVPDVKIIYLPNEDNIHKYEQEDEEPEFLLEGITYAKSETIIIAAKRYDKESNYRKFLGVIIHEFCHFTVHETFGNLFKPYYADDEVAAEKWRKLVEQYKSSDFNEFPVIREIFDYDESKWVDELVVRYPQMYVERNGSEFLYYFEENFIDLHTIYVMRVHKEFESEKEKIASLRSVNKKSLLGDEKSKLYVNSLCTKFEMDFDAHRQIVLKTNQTYLVMKNIFNHFQRHLHFKSKFMFIEIKFLESDEDVQLIKKALQCRKRSFLIINGHDDAYLSTKIQENLTKLLNNSYVGRIILILDQTQNSNINAEVVEHEPMIFEASDLSKTFKNSLKVNFQGSELTLEHVIESSLIEKLFEAFFERNINGFVIDKVISVGNQLTLTDDKYLEGTYEHEKSGSRARLNFNDDACLDKIFKKNPHIIINWIPSKVKEKSESMKMCMRLKSVYPDHWIVHIDFSCSEYPLFDLPINELDYLHYFFKEFLKLDSIENEIFHHFIDIGKVIFIFGGIDINSQYIFNNIRRLLRFFEKTENRSKICILTRPNEFQALKNENYEEIRLTSFEQLRPFFHENTTQNDGLLKGNAHDFDLSARAFSKKMFYISNNGLHNDAMGLKEKVNLNNQAELLFTIKNYEKCIEKIKAALEIQSNSKFAISQNIHTMNLWGNVLFEQRKYSEAFEKYEIELKIASFEMDDRKKYYLINKAVCHYKQKEYDQSIEFINQALKIASNSYFSKSQNARACYMWGFTLQKKKQHEDSVEQFKNASVNCVNYKINDQKRFCLMNQANSYFSMKQYKKSIELIERSFITESDYETDRILDVYATSLWGNALFYLKDYSGALQKVENALNMCTDEMIDERKNHLFDAAGCHRELKNYDKAIELIETALKIKSDTDTAVKFDAYSMDLWGHVLKDQKIYSAAIDKFKVALNMCTDEMNDNKKLYLNNAAESHHMLKSCGKAIELIETALKIKSNTEAAVKQNCRSMNLWGLVMHDQKNYSVAIEKHENAFSMCTDEMNDKKKFYLNDAAVCYHSLKNYDKAIELIEAALKIESDTEAAITRNVHSMNLWASVLYEKKIYSAAIEKFKNAARLCTGEMNDEKKTILNNAANCHRDLENYGKAIELIETALKIESESETAINQNARSMNLWGCILYDQKNYSAAIEKFEVAISMCTDEMNHRKKIYFNNAAACYHDLKNFYKAIKLIGAALKIESDTEDAIKQNAYSMCLWGKVAANMCTDEMKDEGTRKRNT